MTPETTEAVRKALKAMIGASGHHPEDFCDPCVQKALVKARAAIALLDAESEKPVGIKSAEEWANETLPRKPDGSFDWVQFNERIQQDAEAAGYVRGIERAAQRISGLGYFHCKDTDGDSLRCQGVSAIRALLPNAINKK